MGRSELLLLDGIGNVALGAVLLVAPVRLASWLGIPEVTNGFFASLFGAVLIGIGVALLLERRGKAGAALGLLGALVINACFGITLAGWLLVGGLQLPPRGALVLWALALILIGLSVVEFLSQRSPQAPETA